MSIASNSSYHLSDLSQATHAEIQVLRLAAGILDLQQTASPRIRELPSVKALMHAAEAVFDELGFGDDDEPDRAMPS
ncbi:hypothetical protein VQ02_03665 [Methylobacterium variabile]|jgi:hypothetical protein|uniref:Uncharacterized protein n=1 Tax=Methylobacterium variabile TaxID=298794 RepID=A0A0J6VSI5_9HYPH|nr:hypothetical protein [Methylobacterium variabile]KMO42211.1 hypothetical protein VQ02_03665 [Methylobacterium variabile]